MAFHTDWVSRAHLPFQWVAQSVTLVLSLFPMICFAVSIRPDLGLRALSWIPTSPPCCGPWLQNKKLPCSSLMLLDGSLLWEWFPPPVSHLKGFSAQCDYNKADSPLPWTSPYSPRLGLSELTLTDEGGPSKLTPKDTLGVFPVLDSREAKLNEIQHRLMEIIFLLCFRVVNLPVTSAALFLLWSCTIFSSLLYGYLGARTSNLKKVLFLP